MAFLRLAMAAALASVTAQAALAEDAPGLAPSTPWTLDYDADSCALRRMFGEGEDQVFLEFRRFEPGLRLQATIASKRMTAKKSPDFKYRFGPNPDWQEARPANSLVMDNGFSGVLFAPAFVYVPELEETDNPTEQVAYLNSIDLAAAEQESAAQTDTITLRGAFREELTLRLGSLAKPISALNACIDELITHWDIDVEAHKSLTRPATPLNLRRMSQLIDYPPDMARENTPGLVNFRLSVDETGEVTACHIQVPLSDPAFEASSCSDIKREMRFEPALDKDGKPIASYWISKVVFQAGF